MGNINENGISTDNIETHIISYNLPEKLNSSDNACNYNFNNGNTNNNNRDNSNYVVPVSALSETDLLQELIKAYYLCRKRKTSSQDTLRFEQNFLKNIQQLCQELYTRTYKISPSVCFIISEPKLREIFAANYRDRIIHHLVIMWLEPYFEKYFIKESFSCRKEKGTLAAQKYLYYSIYEETNHYKNQDLCIGKFDFSSFFISINKNILWEKLNKFIEEVYPNNQYKDLLLWLVNLIIFNDPRKNVIIKGISEELKRQNKSLFNQPIYKGIPLGNLTSQWFANFYLTEFDYWVKKWFKVYVRYSDDFTVVGKKNKCKKFYREAKKYVIINLDLVLNPKKVYMQSTSKGVLFLGAVLKNNRGYLGNKTIGKFYNKCVKGKINEQVVNSYLGIFKHFKSYTKLKKIIFPFLKNYKFKGKYNVKFT